jgi:hypothetical protein
LSGRQSVWQICDGRGLRPPLGPQGGREPLPPELEFSHFEAYNYGAGRARYLDCTRWLTVVVIPEEMEKMDEALGVRKDSRLIAEATLIANGQDMRHFSCFARLI